MTRHFGSAGRADGVLDLLRQLLECVLVDRATLTGPPHPCDHLLAAERLRHPGPLHDREYRLLDGGKPPTALGARPPAPDHLTVVHLTGVNDPRVRVAAERTAHGSPRSGDQLVDNSWIARPNLWMNYRVVTTRCWGRR